MLRDDGGYAASFERNNINVVLPDKPAEKDAHLRVVDESGGDYLFPADRFVAIDLPVDPDIEPLRSDPRFAGVLRAVNIP